MIRFRRFIFVLCFVFLFSFSVFADSISLDSQQFSQLSSNLEFNNSLLYSFFINQDRDIGFVNCRDFFDNFGSPDLNYIAFNGHLVQDSFFYRFNVSAGTTYNFHTYYNNTYLVFSTPEGSTAAQQQFLYDRTTSSYLTPVAKTESSSPYSFAFLLQYGHDYTFKSVNTRPFYPIYYGNYPPDSVIEIFPSFVGFESSRKTLLDIETGTGTLVTNLNKLVQMLSDPDDLQRKSEQESITSSAYSNFMGSGSSTKVTASGLSGAASGANAVQDFLSTGVQPSSFFGQLGSDSSLWSFFSNDVKYDLDPSLRPRMFASSPGSVSDPDPFIDFYSQNQSDLEVLLNGQ